MGQQVSCPCHNNDSNVVFDDQEDDVTMPPVTKGPISPTGTTLPTNEPSVSGSSNPFDDVSSSGGGGGTGSTRPGALNTKNKSVRTWDARVKEADFSTASAQVWCRPFFFWPNFRVLCIRRVRIHSPKRYTLVVDRWLLWIDVRLC